MQNDASVDWIWSCSLEGNFSFLCYDYKTLLQFLQQCLLVWFRWFKNMPYTYHLKDVNNHDSFLGTDSHLQSISRYQCHNIIQITSLKLFDKFPGLLVWNSLCPFLLIISQFPLTFFSPFTPSSQDKPLAVVLIQLDFEYRHATGHSLWAWV